MGRILPGITRAPFTIFEASQQQYLEVPSDLYDLLHSSSHSIQAIIREKA